MAVSFLVDLCSGVPKSLYLGIYFGDTKMKRIKTKVANVITVKNIHLYFEKVVTKFGNGAKVDCPKKYIGKKAIVVIEHERS